MNKQDISHLDKEAIKQYLPHREPFLLVDEVIGFEGDALVGQYMVRADEPYFKGHFPGRPVMPGVLIIESLAQISAIHASIVTNEDHSQYLTYLAGIEKARFRKPVLPGDCLCLRSTILVQRREYWQFSVAASVSGDLVCSAKLSTYATGV